MRAEYIAPNGRLKLQFDCQGVKELVQRSSQITEIFEAADKCGLCESRNISPTHREYEGNSYYSITCHDCGAYLSLGQHKTGGTLFVKRDQGKNGWMPKYSKEGASSEPQPQQRAKPDAKPAEKTYEDADIPF